MKEWIKLHHIFASEFEGHTPDRMFFAPGRVNLLGEHTDYNGGFVFPAALTLGTYLLIRLRTDGQYSLMSTNFEQRVHFTVNELAYEQEDGWGNYIKGVLAAFKEEGYQLPGADILVHGTIPNGAGLSSSASLEMVMAFALSEMTGARWSNVELAKICQAVENHFIGVNSGIMDQFAVGLGEENQAIFLNTANLDYELVPLELGSYKVVVTNTNKQRTLADSKYNERRSECEDALVELQKHGLQLETLSDLTEELWQQSKHFVHDPIKQKRVNHIVTENERVLKAVSVLKEGDLKAFGQLMNGSHASLATDYEVTGIELDSLVAIQQATRGCIGSRMTGAGFGGCTVSLVQEDVIEAFCEEVEKAYTEKIGYAPTFYISQAGKGVHEL